MFSLCQNLGLGHETLALGSEYFTLWISLFRIIRNEMQSGIKINSTELVTLRMTHSLAHGDGRGSNKRMRSLGNQDLDTGGVDSGYVGSAKVRETLRLPSPRSQCGPCPPAAAVPCAGLRQRAKLSRIPAKPVLPPARPACPGWGLGCKAALQRDAGASNPSPCKLENRATSTVI